MVIMAQMGSFVPADAACLPICDQVFTRVGAADDLGAGQSTFMVEMNEVAYILNSATSQSLILLDEIGRGTGTTDGLAIAIAAIEHIAEKISAKTLFATHYHEIVAAEGKISGVVNLSMSVKELGENIQFLWKVVEGGTNKSHGIFVGKMAGLPSEMIKRAREIHEKLVLRGVFDDSLLDSVTAVEYEAIKAKNKRYRMFLDEFGAMELDDLEANQILAKIQEVKDKACDLKDI